MCGVFGWSCSGPRSWSGWPVLVWLAGPGPAGRVQVQRRAALPPGVVRSGSGPAPGPLSGPACAVCNRVSITGATSPRQRPPVRVRLLAWWKQAGRVRLPRRAEQAGQVRRGPPVRVRLLVRLPVRRGHFRKQPRFFRPLHRAENFQRFFRRRVLCARSKSCFLVY